MDLTRRQLLRRGLAGGVLLAFGGMGFLATRRGRELALPPEGLKTFTLSEYSVLAAVAGRMVPPISGAPTPEEIRVAFIADRLVAHADPSAQQELKQLLGLLESPALGFVFDGRTEPFTQLSAEAQDATLRAWETSKVTVRRTGFQALRSLVLSCYYGSPRVWPALGYPGPSKAIRWAPSVPVELEP